MVLHICGKVAEHAQFVAGCTEIIRKYKANIDIML